MLIGKVAKPSLVQGLCAHRMQQVDDLRANFHCRYEGGMALAVGRYLFEAMGAGDFTAKTSKHGSACFRPFVRQRRHRRVSPCRRAPLPKGCTTLKIIRKSRRWSGSEGSTQASLPSAESISGGVERWRRMTCCIPLDVQPASIRSSNEGFSRPEGFRSKATPASPMRRLIRQTVVSPRAEMTMLRARLTRLLTVPTVQPQISAAAS